jgi:hypothetical protein
MVGVPVFPRWEAGPSSRTGWPSLKKLKVQTMGKVINSETTAVERNTETELITS